jgi:hypothetical protein
MYDTPHDTFFLPSLRQWNEDFTRRRDIDYSRHVPFAQRFPKTNIITPFAECDVPPNRSSELEAIASFCSDAAQLDNPEKLHDQPPIPRALIDDTDYAGRRRATFRHTLTAAQLYQALRRPVN